MGRTIQERHADGGVVQTAYDIFGNRVRSTDALGQVMENRYDQIGQLLESRYGQAAVFGVNRLLAKLTART